MRIPVSQIEYGKQSSHRFDSSERLEAAEDCEGLQGERLGGDLLGRMGEGSGRGDHVRVKCGSGEDPLTSRVILVSTTLGWLVGRKRQAMQRETSINSKITSSWSVALAGLLFIYSSKIRVQMVAREGSSSIVADLDRRTLLRNYYGRNLESQ